MSNKKKGSGDKKQPGKNVNKKNPAAAAKRKKNTAYAKKAKAAEDKKKIMIGAACLLVIALIICVLAFAGNSSEENEPAENTQNTQPSSQIQQETTMPEPTVTYEGDDLLSGKYKAEINVADYGTITLELDADVAPQTVSNFVKLASEGSYDGLTFHRVVNGFMIQGGSPTGTSNSAGSEVDTIRGEFAANGIENNISHVRGTISMARNAYYNAASSQFFIVQQDATYLDGQYAGFGTVTSGMEIVDQICENTPIQDSNGSVPAEYQPVITSIRVEKE